MASQLFARKSLKVLLDEMAGEHRLRRVLGPVTLTSLGIGAIIGTGIFVLVGKAAAEQTGPALMLSFVVSGIACVFAALCYAEFASMAPVAGSAYTYSYATMGELFAWIIGWDLVLEYAIGASAVAHGWSHYFQEFLSLISGKHLVWPAVIGNAPLAFDKVTAQISWSGSYIDVPAIAIAAIITTVLVVGIRESAGFNAGMVILKVAIVIFVIVVGAFLIIPANWTDNFSPYGFGGIRLPFLPHEGQSAQPEGMLAGAATVFFAYIGFDSISTHSEEARRPQRDVPIGIIASLIICTVLYILMSAVLTGMVRFDQIDKDAPVSHAFVQRGQDVAALLISAGAVAGITSVLLVMMLSQPRVLLAMARDGLLPASFFGAVHPRFRTPWKSTILTGCLVGTAAALLPLDILADMVNIGTLLAFVMVCAAVWIMRRTEPDAHRPFRAPFVPFVPAAGIIVCLILMLSLGTQNWLRLGIWLAIGLAIYFGYSRRHSLLGKELRGEITQHGISPAGVPVTGTKV
jgi:APA family basic amino acid/polyamine antiporter